MTKLLLCLLALAAAPAPSRAQDVSGDNLEATQVGGGRDTDRMLADEMKRRLQQDPRVADSLAERINRSSLAQKIAASEDPATRLREIRSWIDADPGSAGKIAVGLAKDDASGTHNYENEVNTTIQNHLEFNPESKKGIYGRLKKTSKDSKLMNKDQEMADEEKREIIKTMFEGEGGMSNRIITKDEKPGSEKASPGGASFNSGYYDRLSHNNLRGYSPQLQAMQSQLNQTRVPGAPKLIETGKLDYETLSYPRYSMFYDIQNLEVRLRYARNFALAKLLGREREFTQEQLLDPALEEKLKAQAGARAGSLSPRFARRQAALERAAAAVRTFDGAALPSKDPLKITRSLLLSLGEKQREASRWITVASLEEELQRVEVEEGFLTPGLLEAIKRAPVDAGSRDAYRRRGESFKKSLQDLKANDEDAIRLLETDAWLASIDRIEKLLNDNVLLRRDLSRNIQDFARTPFMLASLDVAKPGWRVFLDGLILRFLASSAYARDLRHTAGQRELLKDVFMKIGMGDLDAAHTVLQSYEPSAGPPSKR